MTTTEATRAAIAEVLEMDARIEHQTQVEHLLDEAAGEIGKLRKLLDDLAVDYASPMLALRLVAGLAESKRLIRVQARLDAMLAQAQRSAVKLARAHGASWTAVGEALGEDGRNVAARFK